MSLLAETTVPETERAAPCEWCGLSHGALCPSVKAIEFQYADNGDRQLVRVEFFAPIDYPPQKAAADPVVDDYPKLGTK